MKQQMAHEQADNASTVKQLESKIEKEKDNNAATLKTERENCKAAIDSLGSLLKKLEKKLSDTTSKKTPTL